jgi:dTMP kinase
MEAKSPLQFYNTVLPDVDCSELQGTLIVIEGPDSVGRSTQVVRLRQWLEQEGHAVLDTGMARSALVGKGIQRAKEGNTLGPVTMTLYYVTDFADRLENEIIPALRAGFVVLTDRYIFSIIARAIARDEDSQWIEHVMDFALIPHAVYYLRPKVKDLVARVIHGRGVFDYWESGMDMRFGSNMHDSFVRYQTRVMQTLDQLATKYGFVTLDASKPADFIFAELQRQIATLGLPRVEAGLTTNEVMASLDYPSPPVQRKRTRGLKPMSQITSRINVTTNH